MEKVKRFIEKAKSEGAKILFGGEKKSINGLENGYYLSPCVMTEITPEMEIYKEEVFGAVLLIIPFDNEEVSVILVKI